jgi:hypothetical protein
MAVPFGYHPKRHDIQIYIITLLSNFAHDSNPNEPTRGGVSRLAVGGLRACRAKRWTPKRTMDELEPRLLRVSDSPAGLYFQEDLLLATEAGQLD